MTPAKFNINIYANKDLDSLTVQDLYQLQKQIDEAMAEFAYKVIDKTVYGSKENQYS